MLLAVGIGGFFGAIARYALDGWLTGLIRAPFPFGTLAVNLTGSLMVGILFAITIERGLIGAEIRAPLMIGFIGAYTTFSTLMLDSWRLVEEGAYLLAVVNIGGSVLLGLVAVVAGLALGRLV